MPKTKQWKPRRAFVVRKFSAERLARMRALQSSKRPYTWRSKKIFRVAERMLKDINRSQEKGRFIFVGQRMRPFFEAVRGLNEIEQVCPKNNIRYFVTPQARGEGSLPKQDKLEIIRKGLINGRIVSRDMNVYRIVDTVTEGRTTTLLRRAISEINPGATVLRITQHHRRYGNGVSHSSQIAIPTVKSPKGKISGSKSFWDRNEYLAFEVELQDYLNRKMAKKSKGK